MYLMAAWVGVKYFLREGSLEVTALILLEIFICAVYLPPPKCPCEKGCEDSDNSCACTDGKADVAAKFSNAVVGALHAFFEGVQLLSDAVELGLKEWMVFAKVFKLCLNADETPLNFRVFLFCHVV
nr:MAG TPA: hypothetical protein [Caudoviricetes sp.]